jgi:hypothetical protein
MKITSGHTGQHCLRKGNKMSDNKMQSAFPISGSQYRHTEGMALRDYFAAKVMQAMLGHGWVLKEEEIPARAYKMADMMMKARGA